MAKKRKASGARQSRGAVRVQIPASVGFDLGKLEKTVSNLAERLGCPKCFSGFDCTFAQESRFVVDADTLKVDTVPLPDQIPIPLSQASPKIGTWPTPERPVSIILSDKVGYDLKAVRESVANVAEFLSCRECFSGFDCTFSRETRLMVDPDSLKIDTVPLPE